MKDQKKIIAPSILSADFSRLADEIKEVEAAGCDWIHVDVMDGHFVPNLTIGAPVVKSIRTCTQLPLDVHLMIEQPERYIKSFREAGSDYITIHVESTDKVKDTLKMIRDLGAKPGISLRPKTNIKTIEPFLDSVDLVLVMTVEPGFGGQAFMPDMLEKVKSLRAHFEGFISVDGGINVNTAHQSSLAGANVFVAGSAIFKPQDRHDSIQKLRSEVLIS